MKPHNFLFSLGIISWCLLGTWSIACSKQSIGRIQIATDHLSYMDWIGILIVIFSLIGLVVILRTKIDKIPAKPQFSEWKTAHFCKNCDNELTNYQVINCHGKCPLCSHQNPHSQALLETHLKQYRVKIEGLNQTKEFRPLNSSRS